MHKNIICLFDDGRNKYSVDSWTRYANKVGYELVISDQLLFDLQYMSVEWYIMYCLDILEANNIEYEQVLCVNNTTLVHPNTPNIFDVTNNKLTGVRVYGDVDIMLSGMEIVSEIFNKHMFPFYTCLDTNLIIFNKTHKQTLHNIQNFYQENYKTLNYIKQKYGLNFSTPVFNSFFNEEIKDFTILNYEWNMQDMSRFEIITRDLLHTKYGYISQYNNIANANEIMKYTYDCLYKK